MNQELKEQAHKEFDERFEPTITGQGGQDLLMRNIILEHNKDIKSFIDYLIDKTVQHERERIVSKLKNKQKTLKREIEKYSVLPFHRDAGEVRGELVMVTDTISIITNKSELSTNKDEK